MMSGRITSNDTRSFQFSASVSARPHDVYLDKQQTLVSLILATQEVITNFQYINQHKWLLHYPFIHHPHRAGLHRSISEMEANSDVQRQRSLPPLLSPQLETSTNKLLLDESRRTVSSPVIVRSPPRHNQVSSPFQARHTDSPMSDLTILNLDLKLGSHSGARNVVSNLEKKSVASLLDNKFSDTVMHLDKLLSRVLDNTSRVLVTGDLNAGKSTFINALLRKRLLPDDQQPLTGVFCEVIHPTHNNGIEEIHAITDTANYDISDSSTYNRYDLSSLQSLVSEPKKEFSLLKIYAVDNRPREQSLINNGVVDITLIDSPGLNRDIIKTMSLFSRQKEIDVVVFVVNAENHFTLSAKEFLHQAGLEKAYIFIVINKFDNIRDKSRCRQLVLEQIRNLSPRTYADHQHLVHFVSSQEILGQTYSKSAESKSLRNEFLSLESALRTFTLEKRAISKLTPAKTFLDKLLGDMIVIANLNDEIASQKLSEVQHDLNSFKPHHARLLKMQKEVSKQIEQNIGKTCSLIETHTRTKMERLREKLLNQSEMIPWRGILQTGSYIIEMKRRLQDIVFDELIECERFARCETVNCMNKIVELVDNQTLNGPSLPSIESSSSSSTLNVSVVSTTSTYTYPTSTTSSPTASASLTTSVIPDTSRITSLFPVSFSLSVSHFFVTYRNRIVDSFSVMNFASGCGFLVSSIVGFQRVKGVLDIYHMSMDVGMGFYGGGYGPRFKINGKVILLGVGILVSASVYKFIRTLPDYLPQVLVNSIITTLSSHSYITTTSHHLTLSSSTILHQTYWDLQSKFKFAISRSIDQQNELQRILNSTEEIVNSIKGVKSTCVKIQRQVESIELERSSDSNIMDDVGSKL